MTSNKNLPDDPYSVATAKRLRAEREAAGLTQHQLARKAGININGVSRIENLDRSPTVQQMSRLCAALGTTMPAFFRGVDDMIAPAEGPVRVTQRPEQLGGVRQPGSTPHDEPRPSY